MSSSIFSGLGRHSLSCKKSMGRFQRHTALNDIMKYALSAAHVPSRLEPTGLLRSDGKRPDGVTLAPWKCGQLLVWDATCPDTFAASYRTHATSEPGRVAALAEDRKVDKYRDLPRSHLFCPLSIETMGGRLAGGSRWRQGSHGLLTFCCSDFRWRYRGGTVPQC